jgi:hypothetical protein
VKALADAFAAVEVVQWNLHRVTNAWLDEVTVVERPTYETIGRLYDFLDVLEVEAGQLRDARDDIAGSLKTVNMMRGDLEAQDQIPAATTDAWRRLRHPVRRRPRHDMEDQVR